VSRQGHPPSPLYRWHSDNGGFCDSPRKGKFEKLFRIRLPNFQVRYGLNECFNINLSGWCVEDGVKKIWFIVTFDESMKGGE